MRYATLFYIQNVNKKNKKRLFKKYVSLFQNFMLKNCLFFTQKNKLIFLKFCNILEFVQKRHL